MQAKTIEEAIDILQQIIEENSSNNSKLAYFPILYQKVTIAVKEAIDKQEFEDNARMEKLDVVFVNRYLEAYFQFKNGEQAAECWMVAFKATDAYWPIILQHLLLGINAHINLDLGIAAAEVAPQKEIEGLKNDFYKINEILSSMVEGVQTDIGKLSPIIGILDFLAGRIDERIVDFSIEVARDGAWDFAKEYAELNPNDRKVLIEKRDQSITWLGKDVRNPGILLGTIVKGIRLTEWASVKKVIRVLSA
jgi:tetratricopeptide (TPR) repeat protein